MEINILEMIIRTTGAFFAILVLARLIGKKQLSQLTFFHYITGITIGSIAAEISAQVETPFWDGLTSLIWWCFLTIIVSLITMKSQSLRTLVDDKPIIIIENGQINIKNMKKSRLNFDELGMLLREQEVFDFKEIQYAVFETNGQLSVLKYPSYSNATKDTAPPNKYLPTEIIQEGKIIAQNMQSLGLTEKWLLKELNKKSLAVTDVAFAQVLSDGTLYVTVNQPS